MPLKITPTLTAALFLAVTLVAGAAEASFERGQEYFKAGEFNRAREHWTAAAESGDVRAQYSLGLGLLIGRYFRPDETAGLQYLKKAAKGGHQEAAHALFLHAHHVRQLPLSQSISLLEEAERQGSGDARITLNLMRDAAGRTKLNLLHLELEEIAPTSVPAVGSAVRAAEGLERGRSIYVRSCAACHSSSILGAPVAGDKRQWDSLSRKGIDVLLNNTINGFNAHPPKGGDPALSGDDLLNAILFMQVPSDPK